MTASLSFQTNALQSNTPHGILNKNNTRRGIYVF